MVIFLLRGMETLKKIVGSSAFSRNPLESRGNAFRVLLQEGVMGSSVPLNAIVYGFTTTERSCEVFNGFCQLFCLNETAPSQL